MMDATYIELRFKTGDTRKLELMKDFIERLQRLEIIECLSYKNYFTLMLSGGNQFTPSILVEQATRLSMEKVSARRMSEEETLEWKVGSAHWRNMVAFSIPGGRNRGEG